MAASDAMVIPIKNDSYRVYFPLLDADGDLVASAGGLDSERSIDGAGFADCSNEATEISTNSGMYYLDLNASEMNGDCICVIVKTSDAKTTPIVLYTASVGWDTVSDIKSELVVASDALSDVKSELVVLSDAISTIDAAIDSDSLLYISDLSDIISDLTKTALSDLATAAAVSDVKSELVIISDAVSTLDATIDSDSLLYISDLGGILSDLAKTALSDLATASAVSDVKSELVVLSDALSSLDAAVDSDSLLYISDLSDIRSALTALSAEVSDIYSDTTILVGYGASGLTAAQASQLAAIQSDLVKTSLSDLATPGDVQVTVP